MNTLLLNDCAEPGRGVRHARSPDDLVAIGARQPGYPAEWEVDAVLADGGPVHVRPIRSDDTEAHRAFFAHQSEQSVYFRFFGHRSALTEREVTHFTTVDYHDRMAFVAFLNDDLIGIGRYDPPYSIDALSRRKPARWNTSSIRRLSISVSALKRVMPVVAP